MRTASIYLFGWHADTLIQNHCHSSIIQQLFDPRYVCLFQDMEAPLVNTMEQPEFRCPWINLSLSWYCPSECQWLCYLEYIWVEHYNAFNWTWTVVPVQDSLDWHWMSLLNRPFKATKEVLHLLWSKIWEERNARIFKDIAKSYEELNKPRIIYFHCLLFGIKIYSPQNPQFKSSYC